MQTKKPRSQKPEPATPSPDTEHILLLNGMRIRPLGNYLYFRRCFKDDIRDKDGGIVLYRTETDANTENWNELIGVGPKCKAVRREDVGGFCHLPELATGMYRLGSLKDDDPSEDFAIKEDVLLNHFGAIVFEEVSHA